jgi:hypothetical protein
LVCKRQRREKRSERVDKPIADTHIILQHNQAPLAITPVVAMRTASFASPAEATTSGATTTKTMGKKRKRGTIRGASPYAKPGYMLWSSQSPASTNPRNAVLDGVEGFYHVPSIPPPTSPRWLRSLNMEYTGNLDPNVGLLTNIDTANGMDSDNTVPSGTPLNQSWSSSSSSSSSSGVHGGGGTPVSRTIVFFLIAVGILYLCWKTRRDSHEAEQDKLDLLTSNWEDIIQNFEDHQTQMVG